MFAVLLPVVRDNQARNLAEHEEQQHPEQRDDDHAPVQVEDGVVFLAECAVHKAPHALVFAVEAIRGVLVMTNYSVVEHALVSNHFAEQHERRNEAVELLPAPLFRAASQLALKSLFDTCHLPSATIRVVNKARASVAQLLHDRFFSEFFCLEQCPRMNCKDE